MTDRKKFLWPLCMIAFVVLGLYILLGWLTPFLLETAALTPFYTTSWFFRDVVSEPCGLLFYVGSFLQSCFALPWLGALLLTAVLALLAETLRRAFRISLYSVGLPVLAHQDPSLSLYHATWHVVFSVLSMPLA